ncbi:DUF3515 domain-containing protein [Streptomyces inhibens]|uniref:DUF3515 domain-containing protein n=1 Tax=Streptomyces inhibens TaxID=2293571 RepID=A0A371PVD5_STRIH|nr:DUF3515 domain-containing protein [Streptomyces inhibens]
MVRLSRRSRVAVGVAAAGIVVAGAMVIREVNSPTFGVEPAAKGGAPECTRIAKDYPDRLNGQERDHTDLPGVAAWGGGAVVLRCGLTPPRPTTDACVNVDDVDWVLREAKSQDGRKLLITYGRHPAVEATISGQGSGIDVLLVELSKTVKPIRQHEHCL